MGKTSIPPRRKSLRDMKKVSVPPKPITFARDAPKGFCAVCGGEIVETKQTHEGEDGRHSMRSSGLHCSKCGIKYEFMPPDSVRRR